MRKKTEEASFKTNGRAIEWWIEFASRNEEESREYFVGFLRN